MPHQAFTPMGVARASTASQTRKPVSRVLCGVLQRVLITAAGLCPTLHDQLAIQWSFQMGFGHEVWEVTGELDELTSDRPAWTDRFSGKQLAGNAPVVGGVPLDARVAEGERAAARRRVRPGGVDQAVTPRSPPDPPEAWSRAVPRLQAGPSCRCGPGTRRSPHRRSPSAVRPTQAGVRAAAEPGR